MKNATLIHDTKKVEGDATYEIKVWSTWRASKGHQLMVRRELSNELRKFSECVLDIETDIGLYVPLDAEALAELGAAAAEIYERQLQQRGEG